MTVIGQLFGGFKPCREGVKAILGVGVDAAMTRNRPQRAGICSVASIQVFDESSDKPELHNSILLALHAPTRHGA